MISLISTFSFGQILPLDYDTLKIDQEIILRATGNYSGSAIQRDFSSTILLTGGNLDLIKQASFDRHKGVNRLGIDVNSDIEYRNYNVKLFKKKNWGITVKAGYHAFGGMVYSKDLFGLAFYGNQMYQGDTIDMSGSDATFVTYQKLGFGLIDSKTKSSVSFNVYNISNRFNAHFRGLDIMQSEDGQDVTLMMDGEVELKQNLKFNQGIGFGFDVDFRIPIAIGKEDPAYVQFLAKNIGVGYMYEDQKRYSADTVFQFSGLRFDEIIGDNSILNDSIDILDTIGVQSKNVNSAFMIPGFIQVSKIIDNQQTRSIQPFFGVRLYPTLIYSPYIFAGAQWKATKWLALGGNVAYGGFAGFKAGLYTHTSFNKISIGLSTENIVGLISKKGSGQSVFLRMRCAF
jgi:hypothetical protein